NGQNQKSSGCVWQSVCECSIYYSYTFNDCRNNYLIYYQSENSYVRCDFYIFIHLCLYTTQAANTPICICRSISGSDSFYVRLGSLYRRFWYRSWNLIFNTGFLAISTFLGNRLVFV